MPVSLPNSGMARNLPRDNDLIAERSEIAVFSGDRILSFSVAKIAGNQRLSN
jgi:hypothetical protein